ncbi:hypothetical protein QBC35DRAFT_551911 [Podospora australis]|uniref:Uncharacterized protein n=1 Tax=Podospora australis TaxID=1536484 RepID=A0AAN7AIU0_9PEZI|nr:hypothetical protein QBC35DRAFT_551911 [Podospora australis]
MRSCQFSDKRDAIYGSFGLVRCTLPSGKQIDSKAGGITVDYSITVGQVYTSAAWAMLRDMPYLDLLIAVEDRNVKKLQMLPSWVPDFSVVRQPMRLGAVVNWSTGLRGGGFNANGGKTTGSSLQLVDDKILILWGAKVAGVTEVGPHFKL